MFCLTYLYYVLYYVPMLCSLHCIMNPYYVLFYLRYLYFVLYFVTVLCSVFCTYINFYLTYLYYVLFNLPILYCTCVMFCIKYLYLVLYNVPILHTGISFCIVCFILFTCIILILNQGQNPSIFLILLRQKLGLCKHIPHTTVQ